MHQSTWAPPTFPPHRVYKVAQTAAVPPFSFSLCTDQRKTKITGGSGMGEATDQQPFSGPLESAPVRAGGPFSGPQCASCPASLVPGDGHLACFRCLGAEHAVAALVAPASCATCHALPEEGLLSRHLFFSPSVDLAEAIDIFGAQVPDAQYVGERF